MPPNSTLLAFTDGLVERRGEDLLRGLDRLAAAVAPREASLDELLARILTAMDHDGSEDDIAILAFRWVSHPDARKADTPVPAVEARSRS